MCLIRTVNIAKYLDEAIRSVTKVAEEDIKVWKVVFVVDKTHARSILHYEFLWLRGQIYYEGEFSGSLSGNTLGVRKGFHSWGNPAMARDHQDRLHQGQVQEFLIPKGTKYIVGDYGDIASLLLKWI